MPLLVGMDEAGYGPNLGPLVISVTAWRIRQQPSGCDLYRELQPLVTDSPRASDGQLAIADSKLLYKTGGTLRLLETGVLAALALRGRYPGRWDEIWDCLAADADGHRRFLPWYADFDIPLPTCLQAEEIRHWKDRLEDRMLAAEIELVDVRSLALFPPQFNDNVDRWGSKGAALSHLSAALLAEVLAAAGEDEPVLVVADKHGGRNRYRSILQRAFPDRLVEVVSESRAASVYRWGPPAARCEVRFLAGGEAWLPAALASMTCKYLRELAMSALNAYWRRYLPELRPTAGYPVDARRFKQEIAAVQQRLAISDELLWRCR